ncbi:MAG: DUF4433 domain-containing protein [Methylophilaceae bacterium]
MPRHIFRLTYYKNIAQFLTDGEVWAKNHKPMQKCYQTSYANIVNRRGTEEFKMPCGGVVNDFVPFYFSPITAMSHTIHQGNVDLGGLDGVRIGVAKSDEIVFLVSNTQHFQSFGNDVYFTNVACNSQAIVPVFSSDLTVLDTHVNWSVFNELPLKAEIPEVGYNGVCKYFFDRDDGVHMNRKTQRMAEFMIKNSVSLNYIDCIVVQNENIKMEVEQQIKSSLWNIPVYLKPGCYS